MDNKRHILAHVKPIPLPYKADPRMVLLGKLKGQRPIDVICRFTSYVSDLMCFSANTSEDACRLVAFWAKNRNACQKHKPAICIIVREQKLQRRKGWMSGIKKMLKEHLGVDMSTVFSACTVVSDPWSTGLPAKSILVASIAERRRKQLGLWWNWYTLNTMARGLIKTLNTPLTQYSHIIGFDSARIPRPISELVPWLASRWGEWMQRAVDMKELCDVHLPILANSLAFHYLSAIKGGHIYT